MYIPIIRPPKIRLPTSPSYRRYGHLISTLSPTFYTRPPPLTTMCALIITIPYDAKTLEDVVKLERSDVPGVDVAHLGRGWLADVLRAHGKMRMLERAKFFTAIDRIADVLRVLDFNVGDFGCS